MAEGALGYRVTVAAKHALSAGKNCWLLRRLPRFDAAFGIASATKAGETASGDTCSVIRIDERTFLCALSDGMGSGEQARRISDCAVSLIESFYRAGMAGETVLSTVNRLLSFNREESFACIDMATVNLDTGRADIIKIGSPLGFLLADDSIEILESNSLPLGVLEGVRPTALQRSLSDGNVLLLISDGITAAFGSSTDIADFLARARTDNPQTLADGLLAAALSKTGGIARRHDRRRRAAHFAVIGQSKPPLPRPLPSPRGEGFTSRLRRMTEERNRENLIFYASESRAFR